MSEDHYFSGAKVLMNDPQVLSLQCFKLRFLTEKEAGGAQRFSLIISLYL